MAISKEQIEHLARLARLNISEEEKGKYCKQISAILDYFKELQELDTENVEPLAQVFELKNVARDDKVKQIFSQDKVLAEAPEIEKRQIKVRPVKRES